MSLRNRVSPAQWGTFENLLICVQIRLDATFVVKLMNVFIIVVLFDIYLIPRTLNDNLINVKCVHSCWQSIEKHWIVVSLRHYEEK